MTAKTKPDREPCTSQSPLRVPKSEWLYAWTGEAGAWLALTGCVLFASNIPHHALAYWIWLLATLAMLVHCRMARAWGNTALQGLYIAINVVGVHQYLGARQAVVYAVAGIVISAVITQLPEIATKGYAGLPQDTRNRARWLEAAGVLFNASGAIILAMNSTWSWAAFLIWTIGFPLQWRFGQIMASRGLMRIALFYAATDLWALYMRFSGAKLAFVLAGAIGGGVVVRWIILAAGGRFRSQIPVDGSGSIVQ